MKQQSTLQKHRKHTKDYVKTLEYLKQKGYFGTYKNIARQQKQDILQLIKKNLCTK